MNQAEFTHPTMHVIDADKHNVMFTETFRENAWLGDGMVFARGEQRYKVVRQQQGVQHYYVWARKVA